MVELSVKGDNLHLEVLGWDKFLGMKGSIEVPLTAIKNVSASAGLPKFRWTDLRVMGTGFPGTAIGTYWIGSPHCWAFLDVRRSSKEVISLELEGQFYSRIIVEVKNAQAAIEQFGGSTERVLI
jgi:hypothetical protein